MPDARSHFKTPDAPPILPSGDFDASHNARGNPETISQEARQKFAGLAPAQLKKKACALENEFRLLTRSNNVFTGANYIAETAAPPPRPALLHVLNPAVVQAAPLFERIRTHIARIAVLGVDAVLRPLSVRDYTDQVAVVMERPTGGDLLGELRARGAVPLASARVFLEHIAQACDRLTAAGLPGVELSPPQILIETSSKPGSDFRTLSPRLIPRFLAHRSWEDDVRRPFAALIYRIVAGRDCPEAASQPDRSYVPVAGLLKKSNRLLADAICLRSQGGSCGEMLDELLKAEGLIAEPSLLANPARRAALAAQFLSTIDGLWVRCRALVLGQWQKHPWFIASALLVLISVVLAALSPKPAPAAITRPAKPSPIPREAPLTDKTGLALPVRITDEAPPSPETPPPAAPVIVAAEPARQTAALSTPRPLPPRAITPAQAITRIQTIERPPPTPVPEVRRAVPIATPRAKARKSGG